VELVVEEKELLVANTSAATKSSSFISSIRADRIEVDAAERTALILPKAPRRDGWRLAATTPWTAPPSSCVSLGDRLLRVNGGGVGERRKERRGGNSRQ